MTTPTPSSSTSTLSTQASTQSPSATSSSTTLPSISTQSDKHSTTDTPSQKQDKPCPFVTLKHRVLKQHQKPHHSSASSASEPSRDNENSNNKSDYNTEELLKMGYSPARSDREKRGYTRDPRTGELKANCGFVEDLNNVFVG